MGVNLICASPGTGLGSAVHKLLLEIGTDNHQDVEQILCGGLAGDPELEELANLEVYERVRQRGLHDKWNMEDVTADLPRAEVVALWGEALQFALKRLRASQGKPVLSCHLTLYSYRSNEFYSPLLLRGFTEEFHPDSVLVLLDDVFDMFERLRAAGQVYAVHEKSYRERVEKTDDLTLPPRGQMGGETGTADEQENQYAERLDNHIRLEARITALLRLLAWRRADAVVGGLLAAQWPDSKLAVIGTKQIKNAVARWVNAGVPVTYLSHPISRPRKNLRDVRMNDSDAGWDQVPVVGQFNELQFQFAARDVFAIMPTAIDEFRLDREPGVLLGRIPRLDSRWPIPHLTDCLYEPPTEEAPEFTSILDVGDVIDPGTANGMLRALEMTVREEIAFRDHLLVETTQHLMVFRPLYEKGEFSDGVEAEIKHWEALALSDDSRRAVVIHFDKDVDALKSLVESGSEKAELAEDVQRLVEGAARAKGARPPEPPPRASDLDTGGGGGAAEERQRNETKWNEELAQARPAAVRTELWKYLTRVLSFQPLESQVALVIVPDHASLENLYAAIADFLKHGDLSQIPAWENEVNRATGGWFDELSNG